MSIKLLRAFTFNIVFCLAFSAYAASPWLSDYDKAVARSEKTKKPIYLLFVNDHSCPRCKRFKKSFVETKDFKGYAKANLILLKVDYGPYFKSNKKISFSEIERKSKVPKEMWLKGRGPWPHLFLISPRKKILYSGSAFGEAQDSYEYVDFLKSKLQFSL